MIDGSELILKLEHSAEWDQVTASFPMTPWRAGNYVDGQCRRHDQHFDSIFVVRPLPVYVEDLDKPPINVAYQQQVQFLIEGAAVRAESHCYIHWVTLTDFETRRSMVNEAQGAHGRHPDHVAVHTAPLTSNEMLRMEEVLRVFCRCELEERGLNS